MNVKTEFELALIRGEFESSDEKLEAWKKLKQQNKALFDLVVLAMEFSYENGQNSCED